MSECVCVCVCVCVLCIPTHHTAQFSSGQFSMLVKCFFGDEILHKLT